MREDEYNTSADWFGTSYNPPLFGGLNPKAPESSAPMLVGAVGWGEESKFQAPPPLSPWGGLIPDTVYNYDISSLELEGKEDKVKEEPTPQKVKAKKEKHEKKQIALAGEVEKKKRGRPRLKTGEEDGEGLVGMEVTEFNLSARALTDRPADLYNFAEDDLVTVGSYSKAVRRGKIARFKAKKLRANLFEPHIRFAFRKQFAGARPRVGGRFIKMYPSPGDAEQDIALDKDEQLSEVDVSSESEMLFPDTPPAPPTPVPFLLVPYVPFPAQPLDPRLVAQFQSNMPYLESF